ncbi:hypothetical protein B0H11DRAFT_1663070, partial [Mycena galericulata]
WPEELSRAHRAFERGRDWGVDWATCVDQFFDFEAACGYREDGAMMSTQDRPAAVKYWISRARKWDATVDVGELGDKGQRGSFVDNWWRWWLAAGPMDREVIGGVPTNPTIAEWGPTTKLHGKNGLLQVMATLLWWGEKVAHGDSEDRKGWSLAVGDVSWAFTEML